MEPNIAEEAFSAYEEFVQFPSDESDAASPCVPYSGLLIPQCRDSSTSSEGEDGTAESDFVVPGFPNPGESDITDLNDSPVEAPRCLTPFAIVLC